VAQVVRSLLRDVGGRFSRRSIEHALVGSKGGKFPISEYLREHHLFGRLAALPLDQLRARIDALVAAGEVDEIAVERADAPAYTSLRLTTVGKGV
jgi:hypothetical protein